jgi:hypothetical protein
MISDLRRPTAAVAPARQGRAAFSDLRLWSGVGLLLASVVVGAVVVGRPAESVLVWRATRELGPGAEATGLEKVAVPVELADGTYLEAERPPSGRLRWPIAAGTLLPRAALAPLAGADLRQVTVPVEPLHAPIGLQPGEVVDVWWTGQDPASLSPSGSLSVGPELVRTAAVVVDVSSDTLGLGGDQAVVLEVPAAAVETVVRASRTGRLDLVAASAGQPVLP